MLVHENHNSYYACLNNTCMYHRVRQLSSVAKVDDLVLSDHSIGISRPLPSHFNGHRRIIPWLNYHICWSSRNCGQREVVEYQPWRIVQKEELYSSLVCVCEYELTTLLCSDTDGGGVRSWAILCSCCHGNRVLGIYS